MAYLMYWELAWQGATCGRLSQSLLEIRSSFLGNFMKWVCPILQAQVERVLLATVVNGFDFVA